MIEYDRTKWWQTVLAFRGTVLPNVLGRVGALTVFTLLLCLADDYLSEHYGIALPALDQLGHTVLGVAMSLLIVFRTSSSNSRYWDGRVAWGILINGARNLARLGAVYAPPAEPLANLITAYAISVRENLRGHRDFASLERLVPASLVANMTAANNPPTVIAAAISGWIQQAFEERRIDSQQVMLLEQVLNVMVDAQGAAERIQKTPLPFVYAALIKQILLVYLVTLPLVLIAKMGFAAPLVVAVVSFGMLGIEEAGIEIESPFRMDPNSLPLEQLCATIARDTAMLCASGSHSAH
jgi:putative membrane protein